MTESRWLDPLGLCQVEFEVTDLESSLRFYEQVFGWHAVPSELHGYCVLDTPESCPFGIALIPTEDKKSSLSVCRAVLYFHCPEPQKVLEKVPLYGGKILVKGILLPSYGIVSRVSDPDGHRFGLLAPKP